MIALGLLLDLCLQAGEVCDDLLPKLCAILHFLLKLLVFVMIARSFLMQDLPRLRHSQEHLLANEVKLAFLRGELELWKLYGCSVHRLERF